MIAFIIGSLFLIVWLYIVVSYREKTYFNVLSFTVLLFLPANYVLAILYNFLVEPIPYTFGNLYVYLCYFFAVTAFMLSYSFKYRLPKLVLTDVSIYYFKKKIKVVTILLFLVSFILYLPILIEFSDFITNPREIYISTRGGYGHYFFTSLLFLNLALISAFFSFRGWRLFLCFLVFFILAYLHGSKTSVIWGVVVWALFKTYMDQTIVDIKHFLLIGVGFTIVVLIMFYVTSGGITNLYTLILLIVNYSDYTRNAVELIDNYNKYFSGYFYGLLQLQDEFYSRLPRVIFEDKPRAFGSLLLSQAVYPDWFDKNVGDASFGMVGVVFADFGYFAIFFLTLTAILKGVLLRWCVDSFNDTKNVFYFILMLFSAGLGLLPLGLGYLLFEHVLIGVLFLFILRVTFISVK